MRERLTVLVAVQFGADTDEGRSCLCAFFKNMGAKWDILLATSPEAAVHICKVRSVDLVIMSAVFDASSGLNGLEAARQIREAERSMCPTWIHAKPQNWLPVVIVMVEGVELSSLGLRQAVRQHEIRSQLAESRHNGVHDIDLCMWMLCLDDAHERAHFQRNLRSCLGCDCCFAGSEAAHLCPCQRSHWALHRRYSVERRQEAVSGVLDVTDLLAKIIVLLGAKNYRNAIAVNRHWRDALDSASHELVCPGCPRMRDRLNVGRDRADIPQRPESLACRQRDDQQVLYANPRTLHLVSTLNLTDLAAYRQSSLDGAGDVSTATSSRAVRGRAQSLPL